MTIDTDPFPSATINMVSISVESKRANKEISSSQHIQHSKQVWKPKSMAVKEHSRTLSSSYERRNGKNVSWRSSRGSS